MDQNEKKNESKKLSGGTFLKVVDVLGRESDPVIMSISRDRKLKEEEKKICKCLERVHQLVAIHQFQSQEKLSAAKKDTQNLPSLTNASPSIRRSIIHTGSSKRNQKRNISPS